MSKHKFHFLNYKIPKRKKRLLTDDFMLDFKNELDRIFDTYSKFDKPTYWNTYCYLDSTVGYHEALRIASEKHNVKKAIYEYTKRLPWYHADQFDSELTMMMCKKGIIEEGVLESCYYTEEELFKMEKN